MFRGNLEGLVLAEVEFPSREKSEEFESPDWFGEEVIEDIRYKNQNLAQKGALTATFENKSKSSGRSDDGRLLGQFFRGELDLGPPNFPIDPEAATQSLRFFGKDSCTDCFGLHP